MTNSRFTESAACYRRHPLSRDLRRMSRFPGFCVELIDAVPYGRTREADRVAAHGAAGPDTPEDFKIDREVNGICEKS